MRAITDRADAAALPSRNHFAIFRLLAAVRFLTRRRRSQPGLVLHLEEYQSSIENYTMAAILWFIGSVYLTDAFAHVMPLAIAALLAAALSPLVLQLPFYLSGAIATALHHGDNRRLNSMFLMAVLLITSMYYAMQPRWPRWPARAFLALAVLNAAAAPLAWLMRGWLTSLEERCAR